MQSRGTEFWIPVSFFCCLTQEPKFFKSLPERFTPHRGESCSSGCKQKKKEVFIFIYVWVWYEDIKLLWQKETKFTNMNNIFMTVVYSSLVTSWSETRWFEVLFFPIYIWSSKQKKEKSVRDTATNIWITKQIVLHSLYSSNTTSSWYDGALLHLISCLSWKRSAKQKSSQKLEISPDLLSHHVPAFLHSITQWFAVWLRLRVTKLPVLILCVVCGGLTKSLLGRCSRCTLLHGVLSLCRKAVFTAPAVCV